MTTTTAIGQPIYQATRTIVTSYDTALAGTGVTGWTAFAATDICAQISGSATSVTATVERSDVDPTLKTAQVAPADSAGFSGDPATGIAPNIYTEPGVGWWRWNITAISGGSVNVSLSGFGP